MHNYEENCWFSKNSLSRILSQFKNENTQISRLFIMVISHIYWQISTCITKAIQLRYVSIINFSIENANLCINNSTQKITNCSVLQKINFYKRYFMKIAFKRIYTALVVTYYKLIFGNDYLLFISIS